MKKKCVYSLILVFIVIFSFYYLSLKSRNIRINHIFLITIDTLRADHLSCYGYPVKTTPFIDSLGEKGVMFLNAFSASATTCPSHASIMTGLYPSQHRVLANGYVLDDSYTTLAEILKDNGFKTAAFTSTDRHFLASNIDQGFEMYEEPLDTRGTYGYKYRPARLTINNAILWLDNFNPKKKLFMWVHLFDPHMPYHPPKKYKMIIKKQLKKEYLKKFVEKSGVNLEIFENSFEKYYEHILNYDSEIRYVDEELRRFFRFVKSKGLGKNALFIITGDHGEALGQHNWLQHAKYLYRELIHIPLIFYFSNRQIGEKINANVGNIDIFYTILDVLKINNKRKNNIFTFSLMPYFTGEKKKVETYVISERQAYSKEKIYKKDFPFWMRQYEKGDAISVMSNEYHYIHKTKLKDELFNELNDKYEIINLIKTKKEERKKMFNIYLKFWKNVKKNNNKKLKRVDRKTILRLKSLGYIQ